MPARFVSDAERRARIAHRHAIDPHHRAADPVAATRAMTVLHATEPATVYLSLHARVAGLQVADIDAELYQTRSLVKQLAMRRTLFVFPRDLLPAAWGSASARLIDQQHKLLAKELVGNDITDDPDTWLAAARDGVLARLSEAPELTAQELRDQVPELAGRWAGGPIAPRVLTWLGARAEIMRGRNTGHWRTSRPAWTGTESWLGEPPRPISEQAGYAELVRRWLWTFGPATTLDLQWWLGSTKAAAKRALDDVAAVEVDTSSGPAWLLPDDLEEVGAPEPWAALLPVLDPTVMGWKQRDFYLGGHAEPLFDRNGNAGTTAWWDGRIVGAWVQDEAGQVQVRLLEEVSVAGRAALDAEAVRLTEWLDGLVVKTVYPSALMKV